MKSGVKYHYTVAAYDEAGNAAVKGVLVKPDGSVAKAGATKPATINGRPRGRRSRGPP